MKKHYFIKLITTIVSLLFVGLVYVNAQITTYDFRDGVIATNGYSDDGKLLLFGDYSFHSGIYGLDLKLNSEVELVVDGTCQIRFQGSIYSSLAFSVSMMNGNGTVSPTFQSTQTATDSDFYVFEYSGGPETLLFTAVADSGQDSDIYLPLIEVVAEPEPVLKHSYTFETDGSAIDVVGNLDGTLHGAVVVADGKATIDPAANGQGQDYGYISFSGDSLALSTYSSLTLEAYVVAGNGTNDFYTMLYYFGDDMANYVFCQMTEGDWNANVKTTSNEGEAVAQYGSIIDDGLKHHVVTVLTTTSVDYYVDGNLIATGNGSGLITPIGTQFANLFRGPNGWNDDNWIGSIEEFNIYEGKLDAATIAGNSNAYLGDNDARLSWLSVDGLELFPAFSAEQTEYVVFTDGSAPLNISAVTMSANATLSGDGEFIMNVDHETTMVSVTAADGVTVRSYQIMFRYPNDVPFMPVHPELANLVPDPEGTDINLLQGWGLKSVTYEESFSGKSCFLLEDLYGEGCAYPSGSAALDVSPVNWKANTTYHLRAMVKTMNGPIGILGSGADIDGADFGLGYDTYGEWWLLDTIFTTSANAGSGFMSFNTCDFSSAATKTYIDNWELYELPGITLPYVEDFGSDLGDFTTYSELGNELWEWSVYGAKMSGYDSISHINKDYLISPTFDFSNYNNILFEYTEAINYLPDFRDQLHVLVSTNYSGDIATADFDTLYINNRGTGSSWDFVLSELIDLSMYAGMQSVTIVFSYESTEAASSTWEINHFSLTTGGMNPELILKHSYTFDDGTANDYVGGANGELIGNAVIDNGVWTSTDGASYIKLPAKDIAINQYSAITTEAFVTTGQNDGWTMLSYFGSDNGNNSYWNSIARMDDISRTTIHSVVGMDAELYVVGPEPAPGEMHHYVSTLTNDGISWYIDGQYYGTTDVPDFVSISDIALDTALIAAGGYPDPMWNGTIHEFNIYEGVMDGQMVADRAAMFLMNGPQNFASFPVDFENDSIDYHVWSFDGATSEIVSNPAPDSLNPSSRVVKTVKGAGESWAGTGMTLDFPIDLSKGKTFKLKVWSPRVGVPVYLKIEQNGNYDIFSGEYVSTSVANAWEELTFHLQPDDYYEYQNVVVIFDDGVVGDGSNDFTFYFDDVRQINTDIHPDEIIHWNGVDVDDDSGHHDYVSQVTTELDMNGETVLISGLGIEWMQAFWGEEIIDQQKVSIEFDDNDENIFHIPEQQYLTTLNNGVEYHYTIFGTGYVTDGDFVTLRIEYEIHNVEDDYNCAATLHADSVLTTPLFIANLWYNFDDTNYDAVLTHAYTFEAVDTFMVYDSTGVANEMIFVKDDVGGVDGMLVGPNIVVDNGAATVSGAQSNYDGFISFDGAALALNSYNAITLEAYVASGDLLNAERFTMLAYFGNNIGGDHCFWMQPTRAYEDQTRVEANNGYNSVSAAIDGHEIDDGRKHHLVAVLTSDYLKYYFDGVLMAQADTYYEDYISTIDTEIAQLFKGADGWADPNYNGSLDEFNIYNGELHPDTIAQHAMDYSGVYRDERLSWIELSDGYLNPGFDPNNHYYTVEIPYGITEIDVMAYPMEDGAMVDAGLVDVSSGMASDTITVTLDNGLSSLYVIQFFTRDYNIELKHSYTFNDGSANDAIAGANGVVYGGEIMNGLYSTYDQGNYIELPAADIAINTYSQITLEAYIVTKKGVNPNFTMLSYFGDTDSLGFGTYGYFIQPTRGDGNSRTAISCVQNEPWAHENGVSGMMLDDGAKHHVVSVVSFYDIKFYIDGQLVGIENLTGDNQLSNLSNSFAYLARSGYLGDDTWIGSIDIEFNIYEGEMDPMLIAERSASYEEVILVNNDAEIILFTPDNRDDEQYIWLVDQGFKVRKAYTPSLASDSMMQDVLRNADLVIVGRSPSSSDFEADDKIAWNNLEVPVILNTVWAARSTKLNWFNSTATYHADVDPYVAFATVDYTDPVFSTIPVEDSVKWCIAPHDFIDVTTPHNGITLATYNGVSPLFTRFIPGMEFYPGSIDIPSDERILFGFGNDNTGVANFFPLTDNAKRVYYNEIRRLIGLSPEEPNFVNYILPDGLDGDWSGVDVVSTRDMYNYPSQVSTMYGDNDLLITGLGFDWISQFWAEEIISSNYVVIKFREDGSVLIPQQDYIITLWDSSEYHYLIEGEGYLENYGSYPMMNLNYELHNVEDDYDCASWMFDIGYMDTPYFIANIELHDGTLELPYYQWFEADLGDFTTFSEYGDQQWEWSEYGAK